MPETQQHKYIWPTVFLEGHKDYDNKHAAAADGLEGWALCSLSRRPENFGRGMIVVGKYLGLDQAPTVEAIQAWLEANPLP